MMTSLPGDHECGGEVRYRSRVPSDQCHDKWARGQELAFRRLHERECSRHLNALLGRPAMHDALCGGVLRGGEWTADRRAAVGATTVMSEDHGHDSTGDEDYRDRGPATRSQRTTRAFRVDDSTTRGG